MSSDRDTTRTVRSWLEEGVTALPDRVLNDVLDQLPATHQRRAIWWPAAPDRVADVARLEVRAMRQTAGPRRWPPRRIPMLNSMPFRLGLAALAVVAALIGVGIFSEGDVGLGGPADPTVPPTPSHSPSPSLSPLPADVLRGTSRVNAGNRHSVTVAGVSMSFMPPVDSLGWETHGRPYISQSTQGPQGAEAIMFWGSFPDGLSAEPCDSLLSATAGPSAADLAEAVAAAPGTELVSAPADVTVGGRAAKHVAVIVRDPRAGCSPGFFYSWDPFEMGAMWLETQAGTTIQVWILDVDGVRLFLGAATREDADPDVGAEIQEIIDTITFA